MTTTWNTMAGEDCDILLTKADGSTQVLRLWDCIKYEGYDCRKKTSDWHQLFASARRSLGNANCTKGDMRRLICPGHEEHTDWEKVELVPNPDI